MPKKLEIKVTAVEPTYNNKLSLIMPKAELVDLAVDVSTLYGDGTQTMSMDGNTKAMKTQLSRSLKLNYRIVIQ